jgi:hypothetical protein
VDESLILSRSPGALRGDLPDETVVLDTVSGRLLRLNGAAELLWSRLGDPCNVEALAKCLSERYGIDGETARRDASAFAEDMLARGLLSAGRQDPSD